MDALHDHAKSLLRTNGLLGAQGEGRPQTGGKLNGQQSGGQAGFSGRGNQGSGQGGRGNQYGGRQGNQGYQGRGRGNQASGGRGQNGRAQDEVHLKGHESGWLNEHFKGVSGERNGCTVGVDKEGNQNGNLRGTYVHVQFILRAGKHGPNGEKYCACCWGTDHVDRLPRPHPPGFVECNNPPPQGAICPFPVLLGLYPLLQEVKSIKQYPELPKGIPFTGIVWPGQDRQIGMEQCPQVLPQAYGKRSFEDAGGRSSQGGHKR